MATLTASGIADLVNATLKDLGKLKIQQIAQQYVDYPIFRKMFRENKVKIEGGTAIQRNLMYKFADSARPVGLYQQDVVNIENVTTTMSVDWRYLNYNWGFDYIEGLHNKGDKLIFNIMKPRRAAAVGDAVEKLERYMWQSPSSTDVLLPYGIPYWIVKNNTTGFNGGAPSGHSTVGGVNLTTAPKFKNYTAQYTSVSKADLCALMRTAFRSCRFMAMEGFNLADYRKGKDKYCLYTNESVSSAMEALYEGQNENLGADLAPGQVQTGFKEYEGNLTFRRFPIVYVPHLDADTTNPVYGIDHSTFEGCVLDGLDFKEHPAKEVAGQHTSIVVHVDLGYQLLCVDRRRNFVVATNT